MRSFVLLATALAGLHFGGGMTFDSKFMRPHDPVMDQVANILQGILSNLTKHKGYLQVSKDVQQKVRALSPKDHERLVGLLSEQVAKLKKGGESFALDAFMSEHPDQTDARKHFQSALVSVVNDLTKIDPQGSEPSLRELLSGLKVEADGKAVLFVDETCGEYSKVAEKASKDHGVLVVDAKNVTAPGLVDRVPEMYFVPADKAQRPRRFTGDFDEKAVAAFVADHSGGLADARKALVHAKTVRKEAKDQQASVTGIGEQQLNQLMAKKGEDLFVTFFAPWCGHCKNFVVAAGSPLNQLGSQLADPQAKGKLQVLKMDVSSQPVLPAAFGQVQFIPSIFFVPADRSKAVKHEGAQDVPALLAFIDSHAQSAKGLI